MLNILVLLPMFSSRIMVMVSWLIFKSFIYFEFIFVYGVSWWSSFFFFFFACTCPVFPTPLIEETVFAPLYAVATFVKYQLLIRHGLTPGLFVLFHESICLFCQCQVVFMTVALQYSLIPGVVILLALFFFCKSAEAGQGLFWFHINFWSIYSRSVIHAIGILIGIALNL